MKLASIVEGHGEVKALPILIRNTLYRLSVYELAVPLAMRVPKGKLLKEDELRKYLKIARSDPSVLGVIVQCDLDKDNEREITDYFGAILAQEGAQCCCMLFLTKVEFETLFLESIEALRGIRGISSDAVPPLRASFIRDAKGRIASYMNGQYDPMVDQAALTAQVDLDLLIYKSEQYREFVGNLIGVCEGAGIECQVPEQWRKRLETSQEDCDGTFIQ